MDILLRPFRAPPRTGTDWFLAGVTSSFPDIGLDDSQPQLCGPHGSDAQPGCKVFHVPKTDTSQRTELEIRAHADDITQDLTDQVLVFQYRRKFHAIDHVRTPTTLESAASRQCY